VSLSRAAAALNPVKQSLASFFTRWRPSGNFMVASRAFIGTPDRCNGYFFTSSGSNIWRVVDGVLNTGTTWVACSLPASVSAGTKITDAVYYKGYIVIQGVEDLGTGNMAVWISNSALGGAGTMVWTKVLNGTALSASYRGTLCVVRDGPGNTGNDVALLAGEYGDSLTVKLWRTTIVPASNADWTVPAPFPLAPATMRHIHSVECDNWIGAPAGQVWLTAGDGVVNTVLRSVDSGATFTVDQADSNYQAVEISFTAAGMWLAGDSGRNPVIHRRRVDGVYMWACTNDTVDAYIEPENYADGAISANGLTLTSVAVSQSHLQELPYSALDNGIEVRGDPTVITAGTTISAINGATGAITLSQATPAGAFNGTGKSFSLMRSHRHKWKQNAFFGCAYTDPATGREGYVCVACNDQEGGDHYGLFWLPQLGGRLELIDHLWGNNSAFGRVFIYNGKIYVGTTIHPLPTLAA